MTKKLKSAREVMEALLRGEKIHCNSWDDDGYVLLNDNGHLVGNDGNSEWIRVDGDWEFYKDGGWEIYREPPKPCNFIEAVEKMKSGKSMRRPHWAKGAMFKWRPDTDEIVTSSDCNWAMFHMEDFNATDWLPVEEDEG